MSAAFGEGGTALRAGTRSPWLFYVRLVNVLLAVFNMIPIPPLDGGNVLIGILPHAGGRGCRTTAAYGFVLLYALLFSGALRIAGRSQRFILDMLL